MDNAMICLTGAKSGPSAEKDAQHLANYPIPDTALDDRLGWIGTSGSGKTYNASAGVERLLESGARVVIIDPLGVWWRGSLKSAGLIDYPEPGRVALTEAGEAQAEAPDAPPSGEELRRRVLGKLAGPQQRILSVLIEAYPESVSNEECAAKAGYAHGSGGYNNPRGNLKTLNIISYPSPGYVRASDWLFP